MVSNLNANNFLPILDNWETYFENPYEGMGTVYERFILHKLFLVIEELATIESVLEVPGFGMTGISGINSLWWGRKNKNICVADWNLKRLKYISKTWDSLNFPLQTLFWEQEQKLPLKPLSFDLVWNFASLWFIKDINSFAGQVKNIAGKAILICVPNYTGLGFLIRKKYAYKMDNIYLNNIKPAVIKANFAGGGWKLYDEGIFDIPPWPDIAMKKEELLGKLKLNFLLNIFKKENKKEENSSLDILKYFAGKADNLETQILKFSILEKPKGIFQRFWGHHRYFIFTKGE